jgi:hypothetical protein
MSVQLNEATFKELIDGDIKWLLEQENCPEKAHILCLLREAVSLYFRPSKASKEEQLVQMCYRLARYIINLYKISLPKWSIKECMLLAELQAIDPAKYAEMVQLDTNRKIPLDMSVYCVATGTSVGGDEDCDHDYPPEPERTEATFATWGCTKCGMKRTYEVWE